MPGLNHYPWCICGWCYKAGQNGYSAKATVRQYDTSYPKKKLAEFGATRSWAACFVVPNATCPVCFAKVYYYQNEHGSRVFFDELGWPWPKHHCTDNSGRREGYRVDAPTPIVRRATGEVGHIIETAQQAEFDPNARFREEYGHSPFDLLLIVDVVRVGFENLIQAESVSPPSDEAVFLRFTSEKATPSVGDYFSFGAGELSLLDLDTFLPRTYKAKPMSAQAFGEAKSKREAQLGRDT